MFKWLRRLRNEIKVNDKDASPAVAKSSGRVEPPCDADAVEELVRVVGEAHDDPRSHNDRGANRTAARRIRRRGLTGRGR